MRALDRYALALIGVMGDPAEWEPMVSREHGRETGEEAYMRNLFCRARALVRQACAWEGHDLEPVVDATTGEAWWRCCRCRESMTDEEARDDVEGREPLVSVVARTRCTS